MKILLILFLCFFLTDGYGQQERKRSGNESFLPDSIVYAYSVEPFYKYRVNGKPGRAVTIYFPGKTETLKHGTLTCEGVTEYFTAKDIESDKMQLLLPESAGVKGETSAKLFLQTDKKEYNSTITIQPSRQWTVYIYPHSHVDIGYTGLQEDVEKLHVRNVDVGIDLARKTRAYPEGARFIWNTEATWVVAAYLKKATPAQKASFIEAVNKGWLRIDGGHSNLNTTTCSDEELMRFFRNGKAIEKLTSHPITSMVQMDVPGAAWGLVQAAAHNGINGFISFPNYYDVRKAWEHKPFYWTAPDAKSKILFLQGFPYGIGYTIKGSKYGLAKLQTFSNEYDRVSTADPLKDFIDPLIFQETGRLERSGSPYDIFAMTWSMADNCVIDADLPEAVKRWNETYAYPKLVIAGSAEILAAYEKKYAAIIPTYSGDFTEWWTNGLGSDAAHVGMGRRGKEALVQAEILWTMLKPSAFPAKRFDEAWENVLLSAEHTWGYQNPKEPLAKVIEKRKASFFSEAERQADELIHALDDSTAPAEQFSVVNTLSWERSGIVTLTPAQSQKGNRVINAVSGKPVLSQRLTSGELIFQTEKIPALSSRLYRVVPGTPLATTSFRTGVNELQNNHLSVKLHAGTGDVISITERRTGHQFIAGEGANSFHYLPGVYNGKDSVGKAIRLTSSTITAKEKGPLLISLLATSKAEGTAGLEREVMLYANQPWLNIRNSFNKTGTREKEGLHFGFAFNLPNAISKVDAPWSIIQPEADQLPNANRNWMTAQRWVDISNAAHGVTWTAIESPLIEWGELSGNILDGARQSWLWKKHLVPTQTLYSWPVNNHWDTNFPLEQSGVIEQRYAMLFHGGYNAVAAARFGIEQHRPLIAVRSKKNLLNGPLVQINNPKVMLSTAKTAADGKGTLVRLRSVSDKEESVTLTWPERQPLRINRCAADETIGEVINDTFSVPPFGLETLYLTF